MKLGEESTQMIILFDWIRHVGLDDVAFHVANERRSSIQAGALLKRMGVKSGVSDILLLKPSQRWHGLCIELKAKNGKVSASQSKFLASMNTNGYLAKVCFSADESIKLIQTYLMMSST